MSQDDIKTAEEVEVSPAEIVETPKENPSPEVEAIDINLLNDVEQKTQDIFTIGTELTLQEDENSAEVKNLLQQAEKIKTEMDSIKEREEQLTKEAYLRDLATQNSEDYLYHKGGAYWFGSRQFEDITPETILLKQINENENLQLSLEEKERMYEAEENVFKVHLTVPPERKIDVLKAILEAKKQDMAIIDELFATKKRNGEENISVNCQEISDAGGKANTFSVYKMQDGINNPDNVADFIFYARKTDSAKEMAEQIATQLKDILTPLNLPQIEKMPRYSTPVVINGETVPAISIAQGNGDFKDYLWRNDPTTLDRFYDRSKNYALRPLELGSNEIENKIQDIKGSELPIIKVGEITDQLALTIENMGPDDPKTALQTANNASTLRDILKSLVENGMQDINIQEDREKFFKLRDQRFPHISEYFTALTNIEIKAFSKMSYENLTDEEKERCIKLISTQNLVYYSGLKDGSYHFNSHLAKNTFENPLLNEVMLDGTRELSNTEIAEVDSNDKKVQKVHLNVPPNKRIEVLKAVASNNRAGGPIKNYKMRDLISEPNGFSDFIFYAQDSPEKTATQTREEIVNKLYEILAPLNLPETTNIPRFNIPAVINGKPVSYLTVTQGNGDFKQYLSEHNPQALDTLYDKTQNWAVRNMN